jgi:hypothetical protein
MTGDELKKRAFYLAVDLGCEIYTRPPEGGPSSTSWRFGQRSSADQYSKLFDSAEDAAVHFLTTREAQAAIKHRDAKDAALMAKCVAALEQPN